jgi:hypothetical protein
VQLIHLNDDSYELIETKGFETFEYKGLKRLIISRWLRAHLPTRTRSR